MSCAVFEHIMYPAADLAFQVGQRAELQREARLRRGGRDSRPRVVDAGSARVHEWRANTKESKGDPR